jgi:hypothetical protein
MELTALRAAGPILATAEMPPLKQNVSARTSH